MEICVRVFGYLGPLTRHGNSNAGRQKGVTVATPLPIFKGKYSKLGHYDGKKVLRVDSRTADRLIKSKKKNTCLN